MGCLIGNALIPLSKEVCHVLDHQGFQAYFYHVVQFTNYKDNNFEYLLLYTYSVNSLSTPHNMWFLTCTVNIALLRIYFVITVLT